MERYESSAPFQIAVSFSEEVPEAAESRHEEQLQHSATFTIHFDPREEASARMAIDLGEEDGQMVVMESNEWFVEAMRNANAFAARVNPDQWLVTDEEQNQSSHAKQTVEISAKGKQIEEEEEEEEDDDDEEEEWVFEEDGIEEEEEWVVGKYLRRKQRKGVTYYQVQWKHYEGGPTWETREDLENLGEGLRLAEFDKSLEEHVNQGPQIPPEEIGLRLTIGGFCPDEYWDIETFVRGAMNSAGLELLQIAPCYTATLLRRLVRMWGTVQKESAPVLLFHGTRAMCINPIVRKGFIIPGKAGVQVINGSAYGVGIYTARDPGYSSHYTDSRRLMFVCAGLIGQQYKAVKDNSNIVVFFDESQVIPLYLCHFRWKEEIDSMAASGNKPLWTSYKALLGSPPPYSLSNFWSYRKSGSGNPILLAPSEIQSILQKGRSGAVSIRNVEESRGPKPLTRKELKRLPNWVKRQAREVQQQ